MSERRPNGAPVILRMCADILEERDELQAQLADCRIERDELRESCQIWMEAHPTQDEIKAQCEAAIRAQQIAHDAAVGVVRRERDEAHNRIESLESALDNSFETNRFLNGRLVELEKDIKRLIEDNTRLRMQPHEESKRIQEAVAALRDLAADGPCAASKVLAIANRLHSGPRAPSVPRRDTPGIEVDV